jgi:hypothetical protein
MCLRILAITLQDSYLCLVATINNFVGEMRKPGWRYRCFPWCLFRNTRTGLRISAITLQDSYLYLVATIHKFSGEMRNPE